MSVCNVDNRTIFLHDNLEILRGLNARCIDLIYLDPPFNKNKKFTAPIGSSAEGAEFSDIFREEDVKDEWLQTIKEDQPQLYQYLNGIKGVGKPYNFAYLAYMAIRLIECERILQSTGSIYLHCDPTMSHYLKTTMDCIFGEENFRSEIVWRRINSTGRGSKRLANNADSILYYAQSKSFIWNQQYRPHDLGYTTKHYRFTDERGRRYRLGDLKGAGTTQGSSGLPWRGIDPADSGSHWAVPNRHLPEHVKSLSSQEKLDFLDQMGLIYWPKKAGGVPSYKRFLEDMPGTPIDTIWDDIGGLQSQSKERTGYPTQKPLALLERIIKASSNEGDTVLDPFCGCATTCVAAENASRQWLGIDVSHKAYDLVKERLDKEVAHPDELPHYRREVHLQARPPKRTDIRADYREEKFVYIISHPKYDGEYKVGIAKDVNARLNSYQIGDPERSYSLQYSLKTPLFRETEIHIHKVFPNKHEWVRAGLEDIKREIETYASR